MVLVGVGLSGDFIFETVFKNQVLTNLINFLTSSSNKSIYYFKVLVFEALDWEFVDRIS